MLHHLQENKDLSNSMPFGWILLVVFTIGIDFIDLTAVNVVLVTIIHLGQAIVVSGGAFIVVLRVYKILFK